MKVYGFTGNGAREMEVENTLEGLQQFVGGYIECIGLTKELVLICNEEGKINGLEKNFTIGTENIIIDRIVGTAIIAGYYGPEIEDCPLSFGTWKKLLENWGN